MKKLYLGLMVTAGMLASASAYAISVTGTANAIIKRSITATQTQQMDFGTISSTTSAGSVTVTPAGTRTTSMVAYGASKAGIFTITGEPSTALTVTFTPGTISNGSNIMALSNFTSTSTPGSNTTDGSGDLTLNVGADLAVGANQASGTYTGNYTVILSY